MLDEVRVTERLRQQSETADGKLQLIRKKGLGHFKKSGNKIVSCVIEAVRDFQSP